VITILRKSVRVYLHTRRSPLGRLELNYFFSLSSSAAEFMH